MWKYFEIERFSIPHQFPVSKPQFQVCNRAKLAIFKLLKYCLRFRENPLFDNPDSLCAPLKVSINHEQQTKPLKELKWQWNAKIHWISLSFEGLINASWTNMLWTDRSLREELLSELTLTIGAPREWNNANIWTLSGIWLQTQVLILALIHKIL